MAPWLPSHTPVLVVGSGPVGMTLAMALHHQGIDALLVDRHAQGLNTSRAGVIHARTLEVLQPLGVVPDLHERGIRVQDFRIRTRDRLIMEISFVDLPSIYPYALMCPQDQTEAVLGAHLQAAGIAIVRPAQLLGMRTTATVEGVQADIASADGLRQTVHAQWIVGCDGNHSTVRTQAGFGFEGGDYEEAFVLADVTMDWPLPDAEISLFLSAAGLMMVAPLPQSRFRIVATVHASEDESVQEHLQALIATRGPTEVPGRIKDVLWHSSFRIQHRIAATMHAGRIVLCGDAAHVHSPAGGQGMNIGIQDAAALAEPLASAIRTGNFEGVSAWALRRREIAQEVVRMTDAMTRAATVTSPLGQTVRNTVLGWIGRLPGIEQRIAQQLAELDY